MEDFSDCGIHLESEEMADSFKLTKAVDVGIFGNYGPSIDQTRKSGEGIINLISCNNYNKCNKL